ncbi:hypothetical protein [uncultured Arthrobacter sp.]|uniref:hypothetical protein n=1 Tax=uncultured Arthrobacter sp. TaxID=114050 RepID=UPI0025E955BD|nr:hypothetical protein [uncultured Arthrobacter sp.]
MPATDEPEESEEPSGEYGPSPRFLWISLVSFILLTSQAFPYDDDSPKAVLAVTGPLTILLIIGTLIRHYRAQRRGPGQGNSGN